MIFLSEKLYHINHNKSTSNLSLYSSNNKLNRSILLFSLYMLCTIMKNEIFNIRNHYMENALHEPALLRHKSVV